MKILVLKNSPIDITTNLSEATAFFFKHNIKLEFEIQTVNIPVSVSKYSEKQGFSPITGKPSKIWYYGLSDYVQVNIRNKVKENLYDIVIFAWDIDTIKPSPKDGVITSWTMANSLHKNTEYIQLAINQYIKDKNGITNRVTHEILHALCYKANKAGYFNVDEMDKTHTGLEFLKNDTPDAPDGNYALTFKNLAPFLNAPQSPVVTLQRNSDDGVQTLGSLTFGDFKCLTLEKPWVKNMSNISCIPKGEYRVKYTYSWKFMKYTYELQKVSGRSGIRIHSGNFFYDIQGCILLGDSYKDINKDGKVDVLNSRATILRFENLLNKQPFILTIK